jgi:hypothetical protein
LNTLPILLLWSTSGTLSGIDTTLDVGVFLTVPRLPVLTSSAGILKVLLLDILVN